MAIAGSSMRARPGLAAVAAVALLAGCGGGEPAPTDSGYASTPGQSAGQPTPTSAPTLAARGDLGVQSLPADAIPWDEVGLGWFLLSFDPNHGPSANDPEFYDRNSFTPTEEEIYLVSPDASIYFVRDLHGMGNVRAQMWLGSVLALEESTWESGTCVVPSGPLTGLDLQSGASSTLADRWGNDQIEGVLASGQLVTVASDDGGSYRHLRARDLSDAGELCGVGDGGSGASNISPDGSRAFCLAPTSDDKSDVVLYDFATGASTTIDAFKNPTVAYQAQGWTDDSSVIIERWDMESSSWRYWTYDVDTRKLSDYSDVDGSGYVTGFGANAHRVVVDGESATVQSVDGTLGATVSPCGDVQGSWSSETSAVISCTPPDSHAATLYGLNLATGGVTKLATFDWDQGAWISVFPGLAE